MRAVSGLRIVVTGASSGIGAQLARQLHEHGARLVIASRKLPLLEELASELGDGRCSARQCDVTDREQVFELARAARAHLGEIDAWVSNAGGGLRQYTLEATQEQMEQIFRLNCLSALWAYQALIPQWQASGHAGQIVDICSLGGKAGYAYNAAYSAAKHGLSGIGDALRQELAFQRSNIAITTIFPGPTISSFGKHLVDQTRGEASQQVSSAQGSRSLIARKVGTYQRTEQLARAIIRAIERRPVAVYPHRWGNLAVLLSNFAPALMLRLYASVRRGN